MKILITGGSGLVGHGIQNNIYLYPHHEFIFSSSKDVNLCNEEQTLEYIKSLAPDAIIHLASNVGGLFKNIRSKVEMFQDNLKMTMNVLEAARRTGVQKVVSCLSTCIFPDKVTYPITEEMLHDGPPHWSNDGYAYAKRMIDVLSNSYRNQYGCNFICVIPCNVYGTHDNFSLEDGHVIPALIHQGYLAKQRHQPLVVKGSGKPLRQFIHADDLGKLILWSLLEYNEKDNIILANDQEVSIGEIASYIANCYDVPIQFDTSKEDGQYKKTVSIEKLKSYLPELVFEPMDKMLKETIDWFTKNYESVRK
jgi:GDP-L-fucose synthase